MTPMNAGETAARLLFDALAANAENRNWDDRTVAAVRDLAIGLMRNSALGEDAIDPLYRLENIELWGICIGIHSSASSLLGWNGPLIRMSVLVHITVVGENGMCDRHCRTDWLCDMRDTPVLIVRKDCLGPDDAEMFAERIGRSMAYRKVQGPGSANGLGNRS